MTALDEKTVEAGPAEPGTADTCAPATSAAIGCHAGKDELKKAAATAGKSETLERYAADYPMGPHDQPQSMCPAFGSLRVGLRMRRTATVLSGSACCVYGLTFTSHFYGARRTVGYVPFNSETLVTGKLFEDIREAVYKLADPELYDTVVVTNLCVPTASGVPLQLLPKEINGVRIQGPVLANDTDGRLREVINEVSNQTGVVASLNGSNQLVLTAEDGRNIQVVAGGTGATITGVAAEVYHGSVTLLSSETFSVSGANAVNAGFAVTVGHAYSDTAAAGQVAAQTPPGGVYADKGATIEVTVSDGPATADAVTIPDVTGATQAEATTTLEAAGLVVEVLEAYSTTVAAGSVIGQAPSQGLQTIAGATVTIAVSKGPAPTTPPAG